MVLHLHLNLSRLCLCASTKMQPLKASLTFVLETNSSGL